MDWLPIGTIVTTTKMAEALYSGFYKGTKSEYPKQWFEPGAEGRIVATDSPAVRRNISQYVVEFEGKQYGTEEHPYTTWRVRLDPKHVKAIHC